RSGGNTAAALTVSYVISGTASNGNDYASISTSISIPATQTSVTLPINVLPDNVVESTETVILTIQLSATYSIGTAAATVFITDAPSTADVQITKTVDNATPTVGQNVSFTVHATNGGPGVASGIVVQDLLPAGYTFVSKTVSNGTYTESTGVWTVGTLTLNQTAILVVNATVKAAGPYNNTASRTSSTPTDPITANDSATVIVTPQVGADVQMSVSVDNATPTIGGNVTFTILALNAGPGVASGIVVQDLLPTGYTFVSKLVFNGSYDETTGVWTVGTLPANQTAQLRVTGTVKATGSYNDTANKTASTPTDPNTANDTATVTVTPH
ncbi:MAG TPA: Calx-beta domain-containing protein, partial [Casimicrobiaceae bacterium]|nr:Calx-beta domain-containing protein [Casimicrobiaceae bacterium]